jgi:hypothetical protein
MCDVAFSEINTVFDGAGKRGFVTLRSRNAGGRSSEELILVVVLSL